MLQLSAGAGVGSSQKGILRGGAKRVVHLLPDKDALPPTRTVGLPELRSVRRDLDMIEKQTTMGENYPFHLWSGWPRGHCTRLWPTAPTGSGTKK
jgi:hypothetical protein